MGVCVFRCNLPPALWRKWPGSFTCHCGNTGVERTPNKSQHTKLTLEKKFPRRSCWDANWQPLRSWVQHSYQHAIPAALYIASHLQLIASVAHWFSASWRPNHAYSLLPKHIHSCIATSEASNISTSDYTLSPLPVLNALRDPTDLNLDHFVSWPRLGWQQEEGRINVKPMVS